VPITSTRNFRYVYSVYASQSAFVTRVPPPSTVSTIHALRFVQFINYILLIFIYIIFYLYLLLLIYIYFYLYFIFLFIFIYNYLLINKGP